MPTSGRSSPAGSQAVAHQSAAPGTTAPASTTEPIRPPSLGPPRTTTAAVLLALMLAACEPIGRRQPASPLGLSAEGREQPALSGDGRLLATLVERGGRTTVLLQDRRSGRVLPLRHLQRHQPHHSPSLSWTGRYLALLVQQGPHRQAVIEDRATGRLLPLPLPAGREPQRLSLAADGQRIAIDVLGQGQQRVELFDLGGVLEPDRGPGQRLSGGGVQP